MSKSEQALQLTLAMIEKGQFYIEDSTNKAIGDAVVEIYNTIINGIDYRAEGSRKD